MQRVQLSLLGHFRLVVNNQPVQRLRSVREAALLAYLAAELDHPHSREQLAGLLWPDHTASAARDNLKQTLSNLRRTLDDVTAATPILQVERQAIQFVLTDMIELDVEQFRQSWAQTRSHAHADITSCAACMSQLARAVERYQGPFLHNFAAIDSDLFEEWLLIQRENFHQQAMLMLEQVSAYAYSQGDYTQALHFAQRQTQLDPLHERAQRQLLRSLIQLGDRSTALAHFENFQARLAADLAVSPSPETLALVAEIRAGGGERGSGQRTAGSGTEPISTPKRQDWAGAIQPLALIGRQAEREQLTGWLRTGVKVIALLGLGGVGKSSLALHMARSQAEHFTVVIWRSLINAPLPEMILSQWVHGLANQPVALPSDLDGQLALLLAQLRQTRCLLILDNLESVLQDHKAGRYRAGYERYGQLLRRIAQEEHQSTLLLTSREMPAELSTLATETPAVRSLNLAGLPPTAGQQLLAASGLTTTANEAALLVQRYSGHPLSLKLVASTIHELFQDDIAAFLGEGAPIFGDVRDLFEQQGKRLSELENVILRWLAILREPVTAATLRAAIIPTVSNSAFLEAFHALQRRLLLEQIDGGFTLQNVVMEAMTDQLIEQVAQDLHHERWPVLNAFALTQAHAPEYVRQSQIRVIVAPLVERLLGQWGELRLVEKIQRMVAALRNSSPRAPGYAAGNLLNLLAYLNVDLTNADFSQLSIWQADLRRVTLPGVNFAHTDLRNSVFTDTFRAANSIAFSPDGQLLAAGINDGTVRLWRVTDWQPSTILTGHTGEIQSIAFTRDSQRLASASDDQTVRIWDVTNGALLYTLQGHTHRVQSVAFSPDDQLLASGGNDQTVRIWAAHTGQWLRTLTGHHHIINSLAFHPDGRRLISSSWDHTLRIWDVASGALLQTWQGHTNAIRSIAISPTGDYIASGGWDRIVRIWESETGQILHELEHATALNSLAFDPTGRFLATAGDEHEVRLWDIQQGQSIRVLSGHSTALTAVAFHPTGKLLASASGNPTVRIWEPHSGQNLTTLHGHTARVRAVAFSEDGATLVSSGEEERVTLWDFPRQQVTQTLHTHTDGRKVVAVYQPPQAETALIATGGNEPTIRLWRSNQRQPIHTLHGHSDIIKTLAFSPDGSLLASGSNDHTVRVWDIARGEQRLTFRGHTSFVQTVLFRQPTLSGGNVSGGNVAGLQLISSGDNQSILLWDLASGAIRQTLTGHTDVVTALALDPSIPGARQLVSGSWDRTIHRWDLERGESVSTWQGSFEIFSIAVSPDGRFIAASGFAPIIEVWEVATGELRHTLRGHQDFILSVAFQPGMKDAPILVSGSHDETVKLWAMDSGECLATRRAPGPYAGLKIGSAIGLSEAQKHALLTLGAVDQAT
ncbi:MAG: winged helix-turn-helix domain-containing protein [Caldilineaceae bacterium]|nr:winged helix-turn-helix domain-containing protein [Caldilineaceae bacterium]